MIELDRISFKVGRFALSEVSLAVPTGQYGVLMGRTGCGKSTLLEIICGLKQPAAGAVRLMGRDVTGLKAAERGIGYVPQDVALFSTITVRENLAFALKVRRWEKQRIAARVGELAEVLGIGELLERSPAGLSGGEAQRVAIGRALAFNPDILCLDEPLSSLDADTRHEMCQLLKRVQRLTGVTTIHVTHDQTESARLADCCFRLVDGAIESFTPKTEVDELPPPAL